MQDQLNALKLEAIQIVEKAVDEGAVENAEIKYIGRKGELTSMLKQLAHVDASERPIIGALANAIKQDIEAAIIQRRMQLEDEKMGALGERERVDITEPGVRIEQGHMHVVTHAVNEITDIFEKIGFSRTRHPEIDWDYFAFESLNMPADHPARDEWETFFMDAPVSMRGRMVMTPHTSNAQVREMQKGVLPIRMINIAKCYRRQSDVSHVPMFHQFEGLYVDTDVSITHLRGILDYFVKEFFGSDRVTRLRPFHFRFTEPSFEIDISCGACGGSGADHDGVKCKICKRGWLELGGAGMVHPAVLKAGGIDAKKYSGFAFGWGVERTCIMRGLKIDDLRILYKNDLRFLKQF